MEKNCGYCDKVLIRKKNESKHDFMTRKFCDRLCWKKSTQINRICPFCNLCFITYPSRDKGHKIYCSSSCYKKDTKRCEEIDLNDENLRYQCVKCLEYKLINKFYKRKDTKRGFESKCNKCTNLDKSKNIQYRITKNLRTRIWEVLKRNSKSKNTTSLIGCLPKDLVIYLESKFIDGMTWENYGEWHIDHIRPCASFDLSIPEQQKQCFHYTNLQPLWAKENLSKGNKYDN